MATSRSQHAEDEAGSVSGEPTPGSRRGSRTRRPDLRLVGGRDVEAKRRAAAKRRREQRASEEGTTTAEYTVVTGAAVAFGALLFTLLTSTWGNKILTTAFKHVIALLGF